MLCAVVCGMVVVVCCRLFWSLRVVGCVLVVVGWLLLFVARCTWGWDAALALHRRGMRGGQVWVVFPVGVCGVGRGGGRLCTAALGEVGQVLSLTFECVTVRSPAGCDRLRDLAALRRHTLHLGVVAHCLDEEQWIFGW